MLSEENNQILTRVGPGTLMGDLLRRYWTPALLSMELPGPDCVPVRVRLLGENLVAFRDTEGKVGLVAENCPHRGASLYFGRNEECGLRCPYHGWKFDTEGTCVDMPSEPADSTFKYKVKLTSYPVHESGGIVWAYLGPRETMTPFRDFGTDSLPEEKVYARKQLARCNWVQTMEGNLDSAHISWLHQFNGVADLPDDGTDKPGYPSNAMAWKFWAHDRAPRLEVHDTWYGYRYAAIRTTPNGNTNVRITEYCVPYSTVVASNPFTTRQLMVVPIDDENCWRYNFTTQVDLNPNGYGGENLFAVSPFETPFRNPGSGITPREYTAENDYLIDREDQRTSTFSGIRDFVSQDFMVTESMGPIYDRTKEHLATTDKAVIRMRNILLKAAKGLPDGGQPPALAGPDHDFRKIRSAEKNLEPGEDWRILGTDDDPVVQEAMLAAANRPPTTPNTPA
ncbi:Rieske 2Fe-2S domain-containing protein [Amycolatopsis taiwanensis]|uniref:Ring-hydroxylating oxygenase subunit alpha n=1 Tax=Amycolatopsis taiwanensis TaxID=342230 RepID=A0A9W6VK03_9PSEU|nr:Rieske 2Fe-2S domain-containing protein [Amycolatopsis taiwanensis]GLY70089.1 ring-hydroxylating oxygenase subunit alpha [Amycolatopsis taiwanensis]